MSTINNILHVYTDGNCKRNGKENSEGGWAYVILYNDNIIKKAHGYSKLTTNNKMELTAAIKALETLLDMNSKGMDIIIYVDSMYTMKGCSEWINTWKKNNWISSQKKIVKNIELWQLLDKYITTIMKHNKLQWKWVKAHANNKYNNLVDNMANESIINKK